MTSFKNKMISCFQANAHIVASGLMGAVMSAAAHRLTGQRTVSAGAIEGFIASASATLCRDYLENHDYKGFAGLFVSGFIGWWVVGPFRDILNDQGNSLLLIGAAFPAVGKKDMAHILNCFLPVRPENVKADTAPTQDCG
jgi:hypothetical protein